MATKKNITLGAILLTILLGSGIFYLEFQDVKLRIDEDKSTFYRPHEDYSWIWTVVGRERNQLFDGASLMYRDKDNIKINYTIEDNTTTITRTTPYIRGPVVIDEYFFDGDIEDKKLFPIYHKIKVINASGKFLRYEAYDLIYDGDREKLSGNRKEFGRDMVIEWQEENHRWTWVYANGKLKAQYDIPSNNEEYNIRLFDPPSACIGTVTSTEFFCGDDINESCVMNGSVSNHAGNCFNITVDDIIIDGNGYSIDGNDVGNYSAINANSRDNITIKNFGDGKCGASFGFTDYKTGITFNNVQNSLIENVTIDFAVGVGAKLISSTANTILNIDFQPYGEGIIGNFTTTSTGNLFIENNSWGEIKTSIDSDIIEAMTCTYMDVTENDAYIESTSMPYFTDHGSNVTLYNTNVTDPNIMRDPSDVCVNCSLISSSGENHSFTVPDWSENPGSGTIGAYYYLTSKYELYGCGELNETGETYTLNDNVDNYVGTCFNITADNITLDGNGYSIDGDDSGEDYGVYVEGRDNITIKNFGNIEEFGASPPSGYIGGAVLLKSTSNSLVENVTIDSGTGSDGIKIDSGGSNRISSNTINTIPNTALDIASSSNNIIEENLVEGSGGKGIDLSNSDNNLFDSNTVQNTVFDCFTLESSSSNILLNNNIDESYGMSKEIVSSDWLSSTNNRLIYNNSFGEIKFLDAIDEDIEGSITFGSGKKIVLSNNSAYFNPVDLSEINGPANVTLRGVDTSSLLSPRILKDNQNCLDCYNYTSLTSDPLIFNVTSWSNYTLGESTETGCVGIDTGYIFNCSEYINESCVMNRDIFNYSGGTCYNVTTSNIIIDGNGFTLDGDDDEEDQAFYVIGVENVTIKDFKNISEYNSGVHFENVNSSKIQNISFYNCEDMGVWLENTTDSILEDLTTIESALGYFARGADRNTLRDMSSLQIIFDALWLDNSKNNTIINFESSGNGSYNDAIYSDDSWSTSTGNRLTYNNTFGKIDFIDDLDEDITTDTLTYNISRSFASLTYSGKPANITLDLTGVSLSNPVIIKNGTAECADCYNFTDLTGNKVEKFNVTSFSNYTIDEDIGLNFSIWLGTTWDDALTNDIEFRCFSDETECNPTNQNSTQSIYRVCNTGGLMGKNVTFYINQTCPNIDLMCDDDLTYDGSILINTTHNEIHGNINGGECVNISCWANYDNPDHGCYFYTYTNITRH